ncbi:hypothetical protein OG401_22800 [Kitasatospora purpeofusca]|uniref:methylation-associated defense system protein MAD7 n=1 Tax=Kitasatospora purpeofusca TaxID=67352 RepID=UPI00225159DC|nr:hypothetical protein [Kitasatospora purpeofusca]MCX4687095.1 hypothetical protein [Kitasatospora purpeofusca]
MALGKGDKEFRHAGVSYLDYKQVEMDRVISAFLARLRHDGWPARLSRTGELTLDDYTDFFMERPELFAGFDRNRDVTHRWVETNLADLVGRGRATQSVAGLRPLHGLTYQFRNARKARSYGADEHLYEMIAQAPSGSGHNALTQLKEFFFAGIDLHSLRITPGPDVDVETQALINLSESKRHEVTDSADKRVPRVSHPPLQGSWSDLLVDDIRRMMFYRTLMPRSVFVDYLKVLFAFHLGLYHLRAMKLLPAMVKEPGRTTPPDQSYGFFLDVAGVPGTDSAKLAERSAATWFARIPEFVRATFMIRKLEDFAADLAAKHKHGVKRSSGPLPVPFLISLLGSKYRADRSAYGNFRLSSVVAAGQAAPDEEVRRILGLGLDEFTTFIEIVTAQRVDFHRSYLTDCLDSLLLKNRQGAMIAQPRGGQRRFVLDGRLLEVLLQIALLRPGGARGYHTAAVRIDEFLDVLRMRYGLYIDRLPPSDGFGRPGITDHAALRANRAAFTTRLREIGFYTDLSDAYLTQTITPRYTVAVDGTNV